MKPRIAIDIALIEWRLARMPKSQQTVGQIESSLAHAMSVNLCTMALGRMMEAQKETDFWRGVFCSSLPTLSMFPDDRKLAEIKVLKHQAAVVGDDALEFCLNRALLAYPSMRASAMIAMLEAKLDGHELGSRDFYLEGMLEGEESLCVTQEELEQIVDILQRSPIRYSTKKAERAIGKILLQLQTKQGHSSS